MGPDRPALRAGEPPPRAGRRPPAGGAGDRRPAGYRRSGRRRLRRRGWVTVAGAGLLTALAATLTPLMLHSPPPAPAPERTAVASLPYWSLANGTDTVLAHRSAFSEASPWIYGLTASGQIDTLYEPGQGAAITADIGRLRVAGLRIVPTVANITGGRWAYRPVARMLHDQALMERHISALVALAGKPGYAGVDIDYEDLHADDREAFSAFVTRLGAALHAHRKLLSVAVFAKTTDAGYAPRNVAQDYAAIGRAADQVRLMAYDYHWETSPPGPLAPVDWVRSVLSYARTQVPARKIILGIPLYGYDWAGRRAANLTWQQATQLAARHHVPVRYDTRSESSWFSYTAADGSRHEVWFETPASSRAKLTLARAAGIGGVFCWMYGDEAPGTWAALRQAMPAAAQPAAAGTGRVS